MSGVLRLDQARRLVRGGVEMAQVWLGGQRVWQKPLEGHYGTGLGEIPLHLRQEDAVMSGANVVSVPNLGGAGAMFDGAPVGGTMTRSDGGLLIGTPKLGLANDIDFLGARLFVVAKRISSGQAFFLGGENGGVYRSLRLVHGANMPDGALGSTIQFIGLAAGPLPRAVGVTVLHEFQLLPGGLRAWQNGVEAASAGVGTVTGPVYIDVIGRGGDPAVTPQWTGPLYEIALVVTDGSPAAEPAITKLRQALAAKYGLALE